MKLPEVRYLVPPPNEQFAVLRFGQAFYREVAHRQEHQRYCQWYAATAAQNRAEFNRLKRDVNLFQWFRR